MSTAWLAFVQPCVATDTPGGAIPNCVTTKTGQTWSPQAAQLVNGQWYLKGSSGWWPAGANKSVMNGQPVVSATSNRGILQPCVRLKGIGEGMMDFDQYVSVVDWMIDLGGFGWLDANDGTHIDVTG